MSSSFLQLSEKIAVITGNIKIIKKFCLLIIKI